jgi:hypothetical protein
LETFFADTDYSITLDYLEVLAEGKNIITRYGRRKFNRTTKPTCVYIKLIRYIKTYGVINTCKKNIKRYSRER